MRRLAATLVIMLLTAAPVVAQGKGKALGKGRSGPSISSSAVPPSGAIAGAASAARPFGAWLDDASLLDPGNAWASISWGHFRALGGSQTDFPAVDASLAVSRRMQIGGSVPYYRMTFLDGSNVHGMGDVSLHAKFAVIDPAKTRHHIGMSVGSIVEILEQAPVDGHRLNWGVPVNAELRADKYRVFGSTGFFSRGAVFASGALELPVNERVVLTGVMTHMRSIKNNTLADALGVAKSRTDATGVVAYFVRPSIAVFGGLGRTISQLNENATSLMINGGLSVTFAPRITP